MRLGEDLVERAHELGLNVTKVSEKALKEAIATLENPKTDPNTETMQNRGCAETMEETEAEEVEHIGGVARTYAQMGSSLF